MEKRGILLASIFLTTFLFASLASAELTISEPFETYNLGDRIYIDLEGIIGADNGNLNVQLECKNQSINLLKISARSFPQDEESSYRFYKELTRQDLEVKNITSLVGQCEIIAEISEHHSSTKTFSISNQIIINSQLDKTNYDPEEQIDLSITATKDNGIPLKGHISISNATSSTREITNGSLIEKFAMSEEIEPGTYSVEIYAYDEFGNTGKSNVKFRINQIPTSIETALSSPTLNPEQNLTIQAKIYDQSGKEMNGTISLEIVSPSLETIQKTLPEGETITINFEHNSTPGEWTIYSKFKELTETKTFEIEQFQKVRFEFIENTLIITNIGNAVYNKTIEIKIGEEIKELNLNIGVNEERKFNLKAPDGEYTVSVSDNETQVQNTIPLTGNAVSIKDLNANGVFTSYTFLWIFLILILTATGIVLVFKFRHKTKGISDKVGKVNHKIQSHIPKKISSRMDDTIYSKRKSPDSQSFDENNLHKEDNTLKDFTAPKQMKAESGLVLEGEKVNTTILTINLKNKEELTPDTKQNIKKIIMEEKEKKALIDSQGEFIFLIFSPLVTKTFKNEGKAMQTAQKIMERLNEHNKKFRNKIQFGLSINNGELIASRKLGKLKYTSIGNAISLARKMSSTSEGQIYISESIRHKMMRSLRTDQIMEVGKNKIYEVKEFRDREEDQEKLKEILKRMKRDEENQNP